MLWAFGIGGTALNDYGLFTRVTCGVAYSVSASDFRLAESDRPMLNTLLTVLIMLPTTEFYLLDELNRGGSI